MSWGDHDIPARKVTVADGPVIAMPSGTSAASSTITDRYSVEIGKPLKSWEDIPVFPEIQVLTANVSGSTEALVTMRTTVRVSDEEGNSYFTDVIDNFRINLKDDEQRRHSYISQFITKAYTMIMCGTPIHGAKDPVTGRLLFRLDPDLRTERERMLGKVVTEFV